MNQTKLFLLALKFYKLVILMIVNYLSKKQLETGLAFSTFPFSY
jgi:hypothetical protein